MIRDDAYKEFDWDKIRGDLMFRAWDAEELAKKKAKKAKKGDDEGDEDDEEEDSDEEE